MSPSVHRAEHSRRQVVVVVMVICGSHPPPRLSNLRECPSEVSDRQKGGQTIVHRFTNRVGPIFSETTKMKVLAVFVVAFGTFCLGEESETTDRPKVFRRLIPADVLRDFPGMCFASTKCATIEPGKSWELTPFCGRSTCVVAEGEQAGRLLELVEDCGPLPKPNPKCKLSEKTNKTAPFPDCCPVFECEKGVKLEYPELPTAPPPTKADDKKDEKKP